MNSGALLQDIVDQIKESQLKLGYASETVRLYYRATSLAGLIGVEESDPERLAFLLRSCPDLRDTPLGPLAFGSHEDRVEVVISPVGVKYVHEKTPTPLFLKELIDLFCCCHHPGKEQILQVFSHHDPAYHLEDMPQGSDFDYGVWFDDASVDNHCYCFKEEMGHVIYHRFTQADYQALLD